MPDVSPTRWHLAHTTWFFETFLLQAADSSYQPHHPAFAVLFNSYYNTVGEQFPRDRRGLISRPTVAEVWQYRESVDRCVENWLDSLQPGQQTPLLDVLETGLHHEQQHQELMLTDIKHVFSCNPLFPAYVPAEQASQTPTVKTPLQFVKYEGGLVEVGLNPQSGVFSFDNESPRHRQFVEPFQLARRLTTAGEFIEFMEDGGYQRPELWLSAGWDMVKRQNWQAPMYWRKEADGWRTFTLRGDTPVQLQLPVCHVSYFEADAFARWSDARLPTEAQWETAATCSRLVDGSFVESANYHPAASSQETMKPEEVSLHQMYGEVWQWTASPYEPYPGYAPLPGALGEYNGKFMCNQYVLRGASCATSQKHCRPTYRNFFPPAARWQFSGIRLAR